MKLNPFSCAGALLLWSILLILPAFAGETGKIAGRVTDAQTGEPLPGVNVVLVGSTQGAVTDADGYYSIIKVKPGTYSVQASIVGFARYTVQNVRVQIDRTTEVNFSMSEETIEAGEVIVIAERDVVQIDRTTTTSYVDSEQLDVLPVTNVQEAIELQAGVVQGRFRGGRAGEVAYLVNGVPINNVYDRGASFQVEQNMVNTIEVISGVFNAEYGQALSGVVNIVTKDVP
ncbi:MAG: TonB-dependent receptor, partial [Rhodothermaceae bacterium]|nr:TonB-dependent receptor [Rhodothermaceae bacterium]